MCGEMIESSSTRCRFCGEDLSTVFGHPPSDQPSVAKPMTGLVLGISAVFFICIVFYAVPTGIAAIIVGLREIAKSREAGLEPSGMSTGGIVCGVFVLAIWVIIIVLVVGGAFDFPLLPF